MRTEGRIKVMLTTEGTYPFHQGGVSTWCDVLVNGLKNVDYVVFSVMMNPYVTQKFTLPKGSSLIKVPLWGTEDPSEHLTSPFSVTYLSRRRTDHNIVKTDFLPLFKSMIQEIVNVNKNSVQFANTLYELYHFFKAYDYRNSFKDELVWDVFKQQIFLSTIDPQNKLPEPSIFDIIQSLGWLYRFFTILNTPIPKVDVTHSAAAAFCGIPGVLAKMEHKTPFLLTEHGVYLREQYLSINRSNYSSYLKTFLIRFIHSITELNYSLADQVSPVCKYNTRWERRFGVANSKLKVIYNGVDRNVFSPGDKKVTLNSHPKIVVISRIDPVKDLLTQIRAAAVVKERVPNARFLIYGSVTVPEYYKECLDLTEKLGLRETVIFAGHTNDVPAVLQSGDIVSLSSITEGFPYSVVEGMMAGKAVVATDVGGVKEALADCGIVVRPRQPEQMAQAIITLLENPELRQTLGEEAHKRALNLFTIERFLDLTYKSYQVLTQSVKQSRGILLPFERQKSYANKGYALMELGFWDKAITQFQKAIESNPQSKAAKVLLTEIAAAYNEMGKKEMASNVITEAEKQIEQTLENTPALQQNYKITKQIKQQKLLINKGNALKELGFQREAIVQFERAIETYFESRAIPFLLMEIARLYNELGEVGQAKEVLSRVISD